MIKSNCGMCDEKIWDCKCEITPKPDTETKGTKMSGEIDNSEYPKHPGDNLTLDEMIEQLPEPARAVLRQCLKQRDGALEGYAEETGNSTSELKADYDAELMAMLRVR